MKKLTILLTLAILSCVVWPVSAKTSLPQREDVQSEARKGFEEILDLWREGKYDELYQRTTSAGKQSKESFTRRLAVSDRRPACCWEKLQDVTITAKYAGGATIHGRVGMERKDGSMEYETRRYRMEKEDGLWKISMKDILSLAGNGKKKSRTH